MSLFLRRVDMQEPWNGKLKWMPQTNREFHILIANKWQKYKNHYVPSLLYG